VPRWVRGTGTTCSKPLSALQAAAIEETGNAKRQAMYVKMQKMWDKEAGMVWIAYPTYFSAAAKGINPSLRPDGHRIAYAFTSA